VSRKHLRAFTLALIFSLSICPATLSEHLLANNDVEKSEHSDDPSYILANPNLNIPVQPLIGISSRRLSTIEQTYMDAYTILKENNSCSHFFGGSRIATVVLNQLYPSIRKTTLDHNEIGIVMSGSVTVGKDIPTGIGFRLFESVVVNLKGPFFQNFNLKNRRFFNHLGEFPPNTREARVLMLLHELGHLLPGSGAHWLLPDDGGNLPQVMANTATILERCGEQVKSLSLPNAAAGIATTAQLIPHQ
jgi:hypothetical protein